MWHRNMKQKREFLCHLVYSMLYQFFSILFPTSNTRWSGTTELWIDSRQSSPLMYAPLSLSLSHTLSLSYSPSVSVSGHGFLPSTGWLWAGVSGRGVSTGRLPPARSGHHPEGIQQQGQRPHAARGEGPQETPGLSSPASPISNLLSPIQRCHWSG